VWSGQDGSVYGFSMASIARVVGESGRGTTHAWKVCMSRCCEGVGRQQEDRVATTIHRHVDDLLAGYRLADLRVGHLNRHDVVADFHRLLTLLDLEDGVDLKRSIHIDSEAGLLIHLKSGSADFEFMLSNRNYGKPVLPLIVGGSRLFGSAACIGESDGRARERKAALGTATTPATRPPTSAHAGLTRTESAITIRAHERSTVGSFACPRREFGVPGRLKNSCPSWCTSTSLTDRLGVA
jgi:hypothetical protein